MKLLFFLAVVVLMIGCIPQQLTDVDKIFAGDCRCDYVLVNPPVWQEYVWKCYNYSIKFQGTYYGNGSASLIEDCDYSMKNITNKPCQICNYSDKVPVCEYKWINVSSLKTIQLTN